MSMMRVGLYVIPEEGVFYERGSAVVGYDIRRRQSTTPPAFIQPEWTVLSGEYGFHATITDAIDIEEDELQAVVARVHELLTCLRPSNQYVFTKTRVGFWRPESNQAAIHLRPNRNIELLHDILVATIHPLGHGSEYSNRLQADSLHYFESSPSQVAKTKQFHAPYIFEEFTPHFTCINPFTGTLKQRVGVEAGLADLFADVHEVAFTKLCMVAKFPAQSHYQIIEEFDLQHAL